TTGDGSEPGRGHRLPHRSCSSLLLPLGRLELDPARRPAVAADFSGLLQAVEVVADAVRGGDAECLADLADGRGVSALAERARDEGEDLLLAARSCVRIEMGRGNRAAWPPRPL